MDRLDASSRRAVTAIGRVRFRRRQTTGPRFEPPLKIGSFQEETSIPTIHFQVRSVSFREGRSSEDLDAAESLKI